MPRIIWNIVSPTLHLQKKVWNQPWSKKKTWTMQQWGWNMNILLKSHWKSKQGIPGSTNPKRYSSQTHSFSGSGLRIFLRSSRKRLGTFSRSLVTTFTSVTCCLSTAASQTPGIPGRVDQVWIAKGPWFNWGWALGAAKVKGWKRFEEWRIDAEGLLVGWLSRVLAFNPF